MKLESIETIDVSADVRVELFQDQDPESPAEWDRLGEIAYLKRSRYVLGTEGVDEERMDAISAGIKSGELIGLPVFAYVHGGATIRCGSANPFTCEWDSGRSGFVYCTREAALKEFGNKRFTKKVAERALACLRAEVKEFDQYLTGDIYGYMVTRTDNGEVLDSCWGFYGIEFAREEATSAAKYHVAKMAEHRALREAECATM